MSFENWNRYVEETKELLKRERSKEKTEKREGSGMNEKAKEARRAYKREWNRRNRAKVKAAQERYWNKKAAAAEAAEQITDEPTRQEA